MISRFVLFSEHSAADNTADAASADQSSGAERTLPLATDVVCLVRENAGDIGIASDSGEKDAEIADAVVLRETKEWKAWNFIIMLVLEHGDLQDLPIKRRTPSMRMNGALI